MNKLKKKQEEQTASFMSNLFSLSIMETQQEWKNYSRELSSKERSIKLLYRFSKNENKDLSKLLGERYLERNKFSLAYVRKFISKKDYIWRLSFNLVEILS